MRTLLVDDHVLFREGLELVLRHLDARVEVRHADSVEQARRVIAAGPSIDLVLLDLHMPGMQGLDALHALRASAETPAIVVLSGSEDVNIVRQAIEDGAMGFIQKQSDSRTMMAALQMVLAGGVYLPPVCLADARARPAAPAAPTARERLNRLGLSARQGEVLAKVAQGKANKVVARELGIAEATVKSHVAAVFDALDVHSRTEAVYAIARLGLKLQDLDG